MLAVPLVAWLLLQTAPPAAAPAVDVEPAVVDFGMLASGEARAGRFTLHNRGLQPVTVASATPSCKCTSITPVAGRTIPPGGSIELSASMEAPRAPGPKDAKVFIAIEGASQPLIARMQGEVVWPVQPEPPYVDALQGRRNGAVRLRSTDGRAFRVLGLDGHSAGGTSGEGPRTEHVIEWDLSRMPPGGLRQWSMVETDHPDAPLIPLRIRHESTGVRFDPDSDRRAWFLPESVVLCGRLKPGQAVERTLVLENGTPRGKPRPQGWDEVRSAEAMDPAMKVQLLSAEPRGDSVLLRLRVEFGPAARGFVYLPFAVRTATGEGRGFVAAVVEP